MEGFKLYRKWKSKLSKENLMVVILVGLLLVVISIPGKDEKEESFSISETGYSTLGEGISERGKLSYEKLEAEPNSLEYGAYLELSLEELLGKMEGVGEVQVMITFSNLGEKNDLPEIEGIVILAQGAGVGKTSGDIVKVVQTLFDLEAHKIKVSKMNK